MERGGVDHWYESLNTAFYELWDSFVAFVPQIVVAILILIVGWIIGTFVGKVIDHLVKTLKVDDALRQAGVEDIVHRAGVTLNSGYFIGALVKWFILIAFLVTALNFVGIDELEQVNQFLLVDLLNYIPRVIIAVLVIFIGAVVGDFLQKIVIASSRAAHVSSAEVLGGVVKWAVWVFAIFVALDHLRIIPEVFIHTLLQGVVIALALAFGLAFGIGGQKAASEYIESMRERLTRTDDEK